MECDPRGLNANPAACHALGVRRYPTWIVGGQRHEGVMSLDELARLSRFAERPGS